MEHTEKCFLDAIARKDLKALLQQHLIQCCRKDENAVLVVDKAYVFHQLNTRENLELIGKAIDKVFGAECGLILTFHVRNAATREKLPAHDPSLKKTLRSDPKRTISQ
ncbi:hypothetical protein HZA43_02270 [Candidatus Peregrinibacteria bacterium]|nr:hypothetical protein [Candidatus Peregrinibacteria bacterium]